VTNCRDNIDTNTEASLPTDPVNATGLFNFGESVARISPDMIKRSEPVYFNTVSLK
tara:strand:+ start:512195 stop:512362 length:168 start_codon:yes stop_codon:yes gene_type:complete